MHGMSSHVYMVWTSDRTQDNKSKSVHSSTNHHSVNAYGARYGTEPIPKYRLPSKVCLAPFVDGLYLSLTTTL